MIGYPLDSVVTFDNGVPQYDRAVSSTPLRELISRLFSDGVLPDRANDLLVQYVGSVRVSGDVEGATDTYNVVVNPGFGLCNGCLKLQENYYGLEMSVSSATNPRIDTVVLRLDNNFNARSCTFDIVQGEEASLPVPPTLTRNSTIWELGLANIYKPAVVSVENPIIVTDTRLDPQRCGVISSVSEFDTSALYNQIQDDLAYFKNVSEAEFTNWFNNLRTQLSEDVATNLQVQIGTLSTLLTANKTNLVDAINEVYNISVPATPTRTLQVISSQSLHNNPIPTSWQPSIEGMKYTSGEYTVTASFFNAGGEAYKAFDGVQTTYWESNLIMGTSLMVEFPSPILVDKMVLQYEVPSTATMNIQYSSNGYEWNTDEIISSHTSGRTEFTLSGHTAKYWRLEFMPAGQAVVKIYEWGLSDYTISTYSAQFTLDRPINVVDGQAILVYIDPKYSATGVMSNTLDDLPVYSILQAGKRYELMYHATHFTAKEVG